MVVVGPELSVLGRILRNREHTQARRLVPVRELLRMECGEPTRTAIASPKIKQDRLAAKSHEVHRGARELRQCEIGNGTADPIWTIFSLSSEIFQSLNHGV